MPMQISGVTIQGGMNILPRAGAPSPSPTPGPSPAPGPSDPDFSNVVFMFDGDGTDGGANNTFTDSSTNNLTASPDGTVVQGSFSPYGDNWSNYFDGPDYLTVPDNSDFDFGTGDFTIEFWFNTLQTSPRQDPFSFYTGTTGIAVGLNYDNAQDVLVYNGNTLLINTSGSQWSAGVWNHLALARSGTTLKLFMNGTEIASVTNSSNLTPTSDLYLGVAGNGTQPYTGYLSNVRVVKGTALYTSAFTPPTEPLTAVTNTVLLTCQSNRFTDNSTSNHTVSVTAGTPEVTPFSPFKNDDARDITTDGGSAYFDGGDHDIQWGSSGDLALGSGDWSVETWFYMNAFPSASTGSFLDWRTLGSAPTNVPVANLSNTGNVNWYGSVGSGIEITSNTPLKRGEWTHIAIAKSGTTTTMYFNGESVGSFTDTRTYAAQVFGMANIQTNYGIDSYYSDLRILVGATAYTGSFTPPTAPLTAVTNTKLLASFQDAGIYDRSGINNLDTVGDAQIDTAIKKYGTGSVKFDGTDDCLEIPYSTAFELGTQSFTIEFWINTSQTAIATILDRRLGSTSSAGYLLAHNFPSQGNLTFYASGVGWPLLTSNSNLPLNQWVHVAIVRNGSSFAMYFDGNSVATATSSASFNDAAAPLFIGRNVDPTTQRLNGYIDDFRITKGIARYTSNFTPPTAALPKF